MKKLSSSIESTNIIKRKMNCLTTSVVKIISLFPHFKTLLRQSNTFNSKINFSKILLQILRREIINFRHPMLIRCILSIRVPFKLQKLISKYSSSKPKLKDSNKIFNILINLLIPIILMNLMHSLLLLFMSLRKIKWSSINQLIFSLERVLITFSGRLIVLQMDIIMS